MHAFSRQPVPLVLGTALTTASLMGVAWWSDAQRRDRYAARLHRTTVDLLLNALTAGDPVTARHSRRVADLADAAADCYGFSRKEHAALRVAALLHDMGKIDDRFFHILHSCEPLTREQRGEIRQHPHESADILRPLERIHPGITAIVEAHHECWDGQGYPQGLAREEIPLAARIISVADVFDAMTQPRTYHAPLSVEETLAKIRSGIGTRFDPEIVERVHHPAVLRRWRKIAERGLREEKAAMQGPTEETKMSVQVAG